MISLTHTQLTLTGMRLRDHATFANFLVGNNAMAVNYLSHFHEYHDNWFTYIWGKIGSGRSHLLQACCLIAEQHALRSVYLPMAELMSLTPAMLEGLEDCQVVCIDDIEVIAGKAEWEEALFHLYNRLQQANAFLIIAANVAPRELSIKLADLASRLTSGTIFHIEDLSDEEKLKALQVRAQERGIAVPDDVAAFLLKRISRNMTDLYETLDKLDQASLAAQHRLTIPFVKSVLGL
jgi:DnaA family protein